MSNKKHIHPVIAKMQADKTRIEQQLQAGKSLAEIGIKIISPIDVSVVSTA